MKPFTKSEIKALLVIFAALFVISVPNFILSLRRARDQVRRDDLGATQHALDEYLSDFGEFPLSSPDGKIMGCIKQGDTVKVDKKRRLIVNLIPCQWGKDVFADLTPGSSRVYMPILPGDPNLTRGQTYLYFSDGVRYQIFASMEGGRDEAEYDPKVVARDLMCGDKICNVGRGYGCAVQKTLEQCEAEAKR